ncbi:hypothetical protein XFF6992_70025 [Xanthomonas citri pv. fuscans]|nr:hypothetical protein XFF6992_70025 [Xanthomonas citri pv. fuscans]SOO34867.1 hypothetical protein XFF6994_470030 [Xanthomonas citri pv. fuscans]
MADRIDGCAHEGPPASFRCTIDAKACTQSPRACTPAHNGERMVFDKAAAVAVGVSRCKTAPHALSCRRRSRPRWRHCN